MKTRKPQAVKLDEARLRRIEAMLRASYGSPRHHNPDDPLDDLVFLVLSRMTQEIKYTRTYDALRTAMPSWDAVRDAPPDELEDLLRDAGLAPTKTKQVQDILAEIERREGKLDLSHLRALGDSDVERYLSSLPGVGRKTARCVMLYALGRPTCPVDTHVWRVMGRLRFATEGRWSDRAAHELEMLIPIDLRAQLHVTLLAHGRAVCWARSPRCGACPISQHCGFVTTSARRRASAEGAPDGE